MTTTRRREAAKSRSTEPRHPTMCHPDRPVTNRTEKSHSHERGEVGVGIMLAVAITFIVAVAVVNVLTVMYGQAVIRSALDEGVRAGSRVDGGPEVCKRQAETVRQDLLGGRLGDRIAISCSLPTPGTLVAVAHATFDSPLPGVPSWTIRSEATAVQEVSATP